MTCKVIRQAQTLHNAPRGNKDLHRTRRTVNQYPMTLTLTKTSSEKRYIWRQALRNQSMKRINTHEATLKSMSKAFTQCITVEVLGHTGTCWQYLQKMPSYQDCREWNLRTDLDAASRNIGQRLSCASNWLQSLAHCHMQWRKCSPLPQIDVTLGDTMQKAQLDVW